MNTDDATKNNNTTNNVTQVSLGGEMGPITIENKRPELGSEQEAPLGSVETEKSIEQGNEALSNVEGIKPVDNTAVQPTPVITSTSIDDAARVKPSKNEDVEYPKTIGTPIRKDLFNNSEDIAEKAGKGPIDSALTALTIFIDKLLKKQEQKQ